jgi:hypothetical protein
MNGGGIVTTTTEIAAVLLSRITVDGTAITLQRETVSKEAVCVCGPDLMNRMTVVASDAAAAQTVIGSVGEA